jgi:hypothetical protein
MTSARREAVVVFSGGTDSTCAAALAAAENDRVHLLTFFERATASTARLSPNVAKLRERFKNVEFTAQLLSVDPLVRHYSYEGYFKMVREHGALALSTPGFSSLSWHTRTILYCLEHGVKNASDGLTRELMHFPGHMTEVIEHFRALYAHFGVEYTNPVRDWEVPADQQFIDQVIVNTHGGDYLLGEDNVLRRTTGRYLHDLGILPAPNVKGTKLDRLMQQDCYPFAVYNILAFWLYLSREPYSVFCERVARLFAEKCETAKRLIEDYQMRKSSSVLGKLLAGAAP